MISYPSRKSVGIWIVAMAIRLDLLKIIILKTWFGLFSFFGLSYGLCQRPCSKLFLNHEWFRYWRKFYLKHYGKDC